MTNHRFAGFLRVARAPLAACLAVALESHLCVVDAAEASHNVDIRPRLTLAADRVVDTCEDDGSPGSLRAQATAAMPGDTIDMTALACSTITLDAALGAITLGNPGLYLSGPTDHVLTIDAGGNSRVIEDLGSDTLTISHLTIADGKYQSGTNPRGGCVYSTGSVALKNSVVVGCHIQSTSASIAARGAGVYTKGNLDLNHSTITNAYAESSNGAGAAGGGAFVGGVFDAVYSTVSENTARGSANAFGLGGGVYVIGSADIGESTISGNHADSAGGLMFAGNTAAVVENSTISGNEALGRGGIWTAEKLFLTNTTVAFNRQEYSYGGGVYSNNADLVLTSSIIADNVGFNGPSDLGGEGSASINIISEGNVITSSNLMLPMDTISACPKLGPLSNNGGPTETLALSSASPALDLGYNPGGLSDDQRGLPRLAGAGFDIGSFERQLTDNDDRILAEGFDGLCDQ